MEILHKVFAYVEKHGPELLVRTAVALLIVVLAWAVGRVLGGVAERAVQRRRSDRAQTLGPVVRALIFGLALGAGLLTGLDYMGLRVTTLLAGAGIVGLAVGFGAQTLVKDWISGFFLIFDRVIARGDHIEFEGRRGTVEEVGLRVTQIRGFDGALWYVPNGRIEIVGNFNRDWVRAICVVRVAYEQDVGRALQLLQMVGDRWAGENGALVVEPPEAQGVVDLEPSSLVVRLVVKIHNEGNIMYGVERELRRRIRDAFTEAGVEVGLPRQVIFHRDERAAA